MTRSLTMWLAAACYLFASCGGGEAVAPETAASLTLSATSITLYVGPGGGETRQLTATVTGSRGSSMPGYPVRWGTGDPAVATVDANGLVTAVGAGQGTIQASSGSAQATATVTVLAPAATTLRVSLPRATIVTSDTARAIATVLDQAGQVMSGQSLTWRSSDPAVASVSAEGLVFGETSGNVLVSASLGGVQGEAVLTVTRSPRYRLWLATQALGDSVRAVRSREGVHGVAAEIDLDADGDIDLFTMESGMGNIGVVPLRLYRNVGDSSFVRENAGFSVVTGARPVVADIDGDGRQDVLAPNFGDDLPPFPGARQRLFLQTPTGGLADRTDLMPERRITGHEGCVSADRRRALIVGGAFQMPMLSNGQRYSEAPSMVAPAFDYALKPSEWYQRHPQSRWPVFWTCAFFDADGDGVEDALLGSGNVNGLRNEPGFWRTRDPAGNAIGAAHAILWGEGGAPQLSYTFPHSVVPSGAEGMASGAEIHFIAHAVADLDADGCKDVVVTGTDYVRHQWVDVVKGCVARGGARVLGSYHWPIQGTFGNDANWVPGLDMGWNQVSVADGDRDGDLDIYLINDNCFLPECHNNIGMQVRVGVNDGHGRFVWRRGQNTDYWALPLFARILTGWRWDPRL